jgi:hypothetical protein
MDRRLLATLICHTDSGGVMLKVCQCLGALETPTHSELAALPLQKNLTAV